MTAARLYYLMGPSGAGKDSVLAWVRGCDISQHVLCAHRYITRAASAVGENHIALSDEEFQRRAARGLFALTWQAYGLHYGIGYEIKHWLEQGANVLVNGSRDAYPQARANFPSMQSVLITASGETIAARLAARGRENEADIAVRLARCAAYQAPADALIIHNDGSLADAGAALVNALTQPR